MPKAACTAAAGSLAACVPRGQTERCVCPLALRLTLTSSGGRWCCGCSGVGIRRRGIPQARHADTLALPEFMNRGTENNIAILGPDGVELHDVMPPGQSGFVAPDGTPSPHRDDQRALYGAYGRKRQWITRAEAIANTTKAHIL